MSGGEAIRGSEKGDNSRGSRCLRTIVGILLILVFTASGYCESTDEVGTDTTDIAEENPNWWLNRLKKGTLALNDSTVDYPKFLGFCVKVYNWGDKTFNSYDTTYVESTGKRWKAILKSDNWADSYAMDMGKGMSVRLMGDIYCNAGVYLHYMALSIGYSLDMSNIIGNKPMNHKKFELGFTCARFTIEGHYSENTGGSYIRKFGKYNKGKLFKLPFAGVSMHSLGVQAYYFFNNRKYSQGAVYNFSKRQKKSSGSFILGFNYSDQDINIDFTSLPDRLLPYLTIPAKAYKFHYKNYCLLAGYGYNLVFAKNWIFNTTVCPSAGLGSTYADDYKGHQKMFSLNILAKMGLVWNINDFFLGISAKIDGSWYNSKDLSLFNSIENLAINAGIRF